MTRILILWALMLLPAVAAAECFADYQAKKDDPLRLHYGVIAIPDSACTPNAAGRIVADRIAQDGWTLLSVVSVFGPEGLGEREGRAREYYLRY